MHDGSLFPPPLTARAGAKPHHLGHRERLRERTLLGLDEARRQGKQLGRPVDAALRARIGKCEGLSVREAAKQVGCSTATIQKVRKLAA